MHAVSSNQIADILHFNDNKILFYPFYYRVGLGLEDP